MTVLLLPLDAAGLTGKRGGGPGKHRERTACTLATMARKREKNKKTDTHSEGEGKACTETESRKFKELQVGDGRKLWREKADRLVSERARGEKKVEL